MVILAGWIRIEAGTREQSLEQMQIMEAATCAEPGCLAYSIAFDLNDDQRLRVFEVYEDADALAVHRDSAHLAAWRDYIGKKVIGRRMTRYDVSDSLEI